MATDRGDTRPSKLRSCGGSSEMSPPSTMLSRCNFGRFLDHATSIPTPVECPAAGGRSVSCRYISDPVGFTFGWATSNDSMHPECSNTEIKYSKWRSRALRLRNSSLVNTNGTTRSLWRFGPAEAFGVGHVLATSRGRSGYWTPELCGSKQRV